MEVWKFLGELEILLDYELDYFQHYNNVKSEKSLSIVLRIAINR